jgi:hypothetical protein
MPYTKSQLLTKYDIPFEAFEVLQGSGHFTSRFRSRNGLSVVTPTKEDTFALECARLSMLGFRGAPLLPYHRFLVLRLLCLPVKDVYEELINTGLLASSERFKIDFLRKFHKALVKRAPKEVKKVLETNEPPTKKAKVGRARFEKFLSIMNIKIFYDNPDYIDDLGFFLKSRDVFELILTTSGSNDAIAEFFTNHVKAQIPRDAILAYRLLYYAAHEMSVKDWKAYLATVPPDERKAKSDARGKDLVEYSIMKGIQGLASMGDMLDRAKMKYIKELGNSQGFQTPGALQAQRSALDSILKIDQYQRELGGDDTDFWKIFERFTIRPPEDIEPLSITDVQEKKKTQESAG